MEIKDKFKKSQHAYIWEEKVVIFTHHQTVLVVPVVRLVVSPVKPVDSGVPVGPFPLTVVVVFTVTALKRGGRIYFRVIF